jgi:GTP-binding protein
MFMQHYFNVRESLTGLMLIVDSRRGLGEQDVGMLEWILARGRHAHVLLTKSDKLSRSQRLNAARKVRAEIAPRASDLTVIPFSSVSREGLEETIAVLEGWLDSADVPSYTDE